MPAAASLPVKAVEVKDRPAGPVDDRHQIEEAASDREWSKKRCCASPPRTVLAPFSAYGSLFKLGPWP
jgi:hypothetical protein